MTTRLYWIISITFSLFISTVYAGEEVDLKSTPFTLVGSYIGDAVANLSGGIKTGTAYLGMANIRIGFDTEKARIWKGGYFFANLANTHGDSPSETLIGDFQVASNIEAGDHSFVQELWYAHQIANVKIIIGLQDLNVEMANSEHGALYRNSSFGIHSTISDDVPAPIFPLTTLGITFSWNFLPKWNWRSAIYDGSPIEFEHNPHNLTWDFSKQDGFLLISEFQRESLFRDLPIGTIKLGAYFHNHKTTPEEKSDGLYNNNFGFYGVIDQMILERKEGQGIGFFTQMSYSPRKVNEHSWYLGGGINCYGIGRRANDVLAFGIAHAGFRGKKCEETTFELTYKAVFGENIYLQPDIQYIRHPIGTEAVLENATVAALRFGLNF